MCFPSVIFFFIFSRHLVAYNSQIYLTCLSNRSIAHFKQKNFQKSLDDCNAYLQLNPSSAKVWTIRGNDLTALNLIVPAIESYIRAYHFSPTDEIKTKLDSARNSVAATPNLMRTSCYVCGKNLPNSKKCGKCLRVRYCSGECQLQDWKSLGHQSLCLPLKDEGEK